MDYEHLVEGRLIRRYKRFLADVAIGDTRVVAHCANPGAMSTCAPEGARVWLSASKNPKRKLAWTWELVLAEDALVGVHTGRANSLVAEAWREGRIAELVEYRHMDAEVRVGEKSRLDFRFSQGRAGEPCFVEVKNVTMNAGDGVAAFPDSVTKRGTRHLGELATLCDQGVRAVLLFVCTRENTKLLRVAHHVDPLYGQAIQDAASRGVEIVGYGCVLSPQSIRVDHALPVDLSLS